MRKLFGVVALVMVAGPAGAQSLTNAGFESGDLTGWTTNLGPCGSPANISATNASANTGAYSLSITRNAVNSCDAWVFQPFDFVAGDVYQVDYWARYTTPVDQNNSDTFVAYGSTSTFLSALSRNPNGDGSWTHLSANLYFVNTGGALWIGARSSDGSVLIDDIAITDISGQVVTTPEPGSVALLAAGLVGVAPFARRRRA